MRISYRQGLVSAQSNFLQIGQQNSQYIDIIVSPTPVIAAIASGTKDYLIAETRSVTNAWGPFTDSLTHYLYWEINRQDGSVVRGETVLPLIIAASAPASPAVGQMWWDSVSSYMKEWNGSRWNVVLRVFAGSVSGSVVNQEPLASQVNLNTPVDAGYIASDGLGGVFRASNGDFLTTASPIVAQDTGSLVKLDGAQVTVQANENIPRFSAVYLVGGRAALASSVAPDNITKAPIALVTVDAYQNDSVNLVTSGRLVVNEQWSWSNANLGKTVYCDATGQLTTVKPSALKNVRVGTIVTSNSILLNFDWETDPALGQVGLTGINAIAPLTQFGSPEFPSISIPRASELGNGYMHMDDFARIVAVETALPSKANVVHTHIIDDVTGLQLALNAKANTVHSHMIADVSGLQLALDGKANTVHNHAIADVVGLQGELDTIAISLNARANKVIGAVVGNFASLDASGNITDSGSNNSTFALSSHSHAISDVVGLQGILDNKSDVGHSHIIDDVEGLQLSLDGKANLSHTHIIADVIGLQTALDGRALVIHTHAISDITGLQAALDGKSNTGHIHSIAQVLGLQAELDGKALVVHTHAISDITGLQAELDGKAPVIHSHAIADITGLQTALDAKSNTTHNHALSTLSDVAISFPSASEVLTFDGTNWVNAPGGSGPSTSKSPLKVVLTSFGTHTFDGAEVNSWNSNVFYQGVDVSWDSGNNEVVISGNPNSVWNVTAEVKMMPTDLTWPHGDVMFGTHISPGTGGPILQSFTINRSVHTSNLSVSNTLPYQEMAFTDHFTVHASTTDPATFKIGAYAFSDDHPTENISYMIILTVEYGGQNSMS